MTCDWETLSYRHFERKREIFVIRDQAGDVRYSQTGNLLSTYFRALPIYIRGEAATFIPNSSFAQSLHSESVNGTPQGLTMEGAHHSQRTPTPAII